MIELDLRGLRCPHPALWTQRRLAAMQPGECLAVSADDPLAAIDIPHACARGGHRLLRQTVVDGSGHVRFEIECHGNGRSHAVE